MTEQAARERELKERLKPHGTAIADGALLEVDPRLAQAFGGGVPPEEITIWAGMPPAQRAKALQRIAALKRYCVDEGGPTAKAAAAEAGVELGRFYQMVRAWRTLKSLRSLGAYASATRERRGVKPEVANALQKVVKGVVEENRGATLAATLAALAAASGLPKADIPTRNTLKAFIDREQRRVRATELAGSEVLFDYSATSLRREDGTSHDAFLVIDAGTGLVLGHAIGEDAHSLSGHALAAADARRRMDVGGLSGAIWADRLERSQIVPGREEPDAAAAAARIAGRIGGGSPQLTGDRARGRYIREHLGLKLGPIRFFPNKTRAAANGSVVGEPIGGSDAHARLELAVSSHNAALLADLTLAGSIRPPAGLTTLLDLLAAL